jgi:predicted dehydrogenase
MNRIGNDAQDGGATRREFIKKSTLAAAAAASVNLFKTPVYGQTQAPSPGNVIGANSRIRVGYIGVGLQGKLHLDNQKASAAANNLEQVAVCDLSKTLRGIAKAEIGGNCKAFDNYEEMLAMKDLDAVTVATNNHAHCKVALAALDAGKHIYLEKPMTRYLPEAFQVYDKVKATGKIVQIGSQGCTAQAWHEAAKMIKGGQIGPVVWAQGYYCRNSINGEWNDRPIPSWVSPDDVNWDKWQDPVHDKQPFSAEAFWRWRKYYQYCTGPLEDLAPHRLLPLMLATGNPEFPTRVTSLGTQNVKADLAPPPHVQRTVPEHQSLLAEFPSGTTILVVVSTVVARSPGFAIYGHKAVLEIGSSGESVHLIPEKPFSDEVDLANIDSLTPVENIPDHEKNWFDCIRSNKQPNANIDLAIRGQVVISLAEMSTRLNMMCVWDEKNRKIKTQDGKEIAAISYGSVNPS